MFYSKRPKPLVTCIGSITIDLFFPTNEGIIIETPEDLLSQRKIAFELGGKISAPEQHTAVGGVAANVAQGLSLLGTTARCYSVVGKDTNGKLCLDTLTRHGVDTDIMTMLPDAKTDLSAVIVLMKEGDRTIIHNRDSNKHLVVEEKNLQTPWVFISSLNGDWQKNIETILSAQKKENTKIALNPGQHNLKEDPALISRVISKSELLVLNKDEALEIVSHKKPEAETSELENEVFLLRSLLEMGASTVALTDGLRGAWCANKEALWFVAVPPVTNVVDTTGAGDAFTSGFFAAFLKNRSLDVCLRFGMANSQSVIKYYGGEAGLLTAEVIEKAILHIIPQKLN